MTLDKFIRGIQIASKYYDDMNKHHIASEHDIFYLCATDREMSEDDVAEMKSLGWFQPESRKEYSVEEAWACWT